ncbi:MAG: UDP-N-acetylmuramoyl-L-alanyl-D-glutamate--2,6-diaminopimelate ligase [Kosmotogales bacterium]|nr:UDP-N-acetylmuramoyl-L-alanyl-D-glutamate--2,6-diaminopimelate ligase [Kosmotogales bacterium]
MRLNAIVDLLGKNCKSFINFEDVEIQRVSSNSKDIRKGDLFVCIKGNNFDSHYVAKEAEEKGTKAIIAQDKLIDESKIKIPIIYVEDSRRAESFIRYNFYLNPHKRLNMIGVTGTNGKTTVTTLIYHVINHFLGKVSLVGTVSNIIAGDIFKEPVNTTPSSELLCKYMLESIDKNFDYFVMEVSSHAIASKRIDGLEFDIAILTNITRDHLDFHKNFDDYYNTKLKIFDMLKKDGVGIINSDKLSKEDLKQTNRKIISFGLGQDADYQIKNIEFNKEGMEFYIVLPDGSQKRVISRLIGQYNAYNLTAAIAALHQMNFEIDHIIQAMVDFSGIAGRFEFVEKARMYGFEVIIDFAHTPDALEKILLTAKKIAKGRIILVFGAGGSADIGKRPMMAQIASKYSDVVILTNDDPKYDDPEKILDQLEAGMDISVPYLRLSNRREAISVALTLCNREDIVLIAGRGHETYQILDNKKVLFNDKDVVKELLEKKFRRQ